jgi:NADPH-dependent ferric siderophore reductase
MTAPTGRHRARVVGVDRMTPRMRRVTLHAPTLTALPLQPAQDVGLVFTDPGTRRELRRRYTIRAADRAAGTVVLDGILHGHGPGATWFATAEPGWEVTLVGPRGKVAIARADWHLFVGDESALPAFAELAAALPSHARAQAVIEVEDAAEEQPLSASGAVAITWVHRSGTPAGHAEGLAAAVAAAALPSGIGAAYLLGESRAMIALRAVVVERGIAADDVFIKGYWNRGRGA